MTCKRRNLGVEEEGWSREGMVMQSPMNGETSVIYCRGKQNWKIGGPARRGDGSLGGEQGEQRPAR